MLTTSFFHFSFFTLLANMNDISNSQPSSTSPQPQPTDIGVSDTKAQKQLRTRYNLIRELITTEESFTKDLDIVMSVYLRYASVHPYCEYLDPKDISVLFGNVPQILNAAQSFLSNLKSWVPSYIYRECDLIPPAHVSPDSTSASFLKDCTSNIGVAVLEYLPTLERVFKTYCTQNEMQMNTFYRIQKLGTPTIERWFVECHEQSRSLTQAWTLDSLLIKPVQRLLKYPLLIASMIENTPESHPDYESLKKALKEVQSCANRINNDAEMSTSSTFSSLATAKSAASNNNSETNTDTSSSASSSSSSSSPNTTTPPTPHSITFSASLHSPDMIPTAKFSTITSPATKPIQKDYNTMLLGLKDTHDADDDLCAQLASFHSKYGMVKNLIGAVQGNVAFIQNHFDVNSGLANCWMNWIDLLDDDNNPILDTEETHSGAHTVQHKPQTNHQTRPYRHKSPNKVINDLLSQTKNNLKQYRRYAMFCLTFTTASSAHLSSNRLKRKVDSNVIAPLAQVLGMFRNILAVIDERKRLHAQFIKYLQYKSTHQMTGASAAAPSGLPSLSNIDFAPTANSTIPLSTTISNSSQAANNKFQHSAADTILFRNADRFWRIHTRLKTELPVLFDLCDQMADVCLARFIAIQNDWFKVVLDATSNVCQMDPEEVARDVLVPDEENDVRQDLIINSFHERVTQEGIHKYASEQFTVSNKDSSASIVAPSLQGRRAPHNPIIQVTGPSNPETTLTSIHSSASAVSFPSVVSSCRNSQDLTGTSIGSNMSIASAQSSTTTSNTTLSTTNSYIDVAASLSSKQQHHQQLASKPNHHGSDGTLELISAKIGNESFTSSKQSVDYICSSIDQALASPINLGNTSSNVELQVKSQIEEAIDAVLLEFNEMPTETCTNSYDELTVMNDAINIHTNLRPKPSTTQLRDICSIMEEEEEDEDELCLIDDCDNLLSHPVYQSYLLTDEENGGFEDDLNIELEASDNFDLTEDMDNYMSSQTSVVTFQASSDSTTSSNEKKQQMKSVSSTCTESQTCDSMVLPATSRIAPTTSLHATEASKPLANIPKSHSSSLVPHKIDDIDFPPVSKSLNNRLSTTSRILFQRPVHMAKDHAIRRKSSLFAFSGLSKLGNKLSGNGTGHSQISNNVNASNPNLFSLGSHHHSHPLHQHQPNNTPGINAFDSLS